MLKKTDLLRLTTLALFLIVVLVLVSLLIPTHTPVTIPTLIQLPLQSLPMNIQVGIIPTELPGYSLTAEAANAAANPTAPPVSLNVRPPLQSAPPQTVLPVEANAISLSVRTSEIPTETNARTTEPTLTDVYQSLPTALPFPTVPPALAPTYTYELQALPPPQTVPNQVVIAFKPETSQQERDAYVASLGGEVKQSIDALNTVVVEVPAQTAAASAPDSSLVEATEPDYYVSAQVAVPPSDPFYSQQWALPIIGAPDAWLTMPADAPNVVVAVIDSGICANNPDLTARVLPGWDYVENDDQPQDALGHGCGVAGIIAANADDGIGMAGVAPNALILPLRVLNAQGIGTYSDVATAIIYATDHGAQVINLSLGGVNPSSLLEQAVDYAVGKGVTVIAAAGNTGSDQVLYPATYEPVISVGSVDENLEVSSFSSRGANVDLFAPGRNILMTGNDGDIHASSGTSFAAPEVAGIVALEIAHGHTLNQQGGIVHFGNAAPATEEAPTQAPIDESNLTDKERALLDEVRTQGQTSVIVGLNAQFNYSGQTSPQELAAQEAVVQQVRTDLLSSLSAYDVEVLSDSASWAIPFVALRVRRERTVGTDRLAKRNVN